VKTDKYETVIKALQNAHHRLPRGNYLSLLSQKLHKNYIFLIILIKNATVTSMYSHRSDPALRCL